MIRRALTNTGWLMGAREELGVLEDLATARHLPPLLVGQRLGVLVR